jgi:hypothetical protein
MQLEFADLGGSGMRNILKIAAVVGALSVSVSSVQARGPYGSISVGAWNGGAFTSDSNGQFTGCIASATYNSGINFGVMVDPKFNWVLAFSHPSWNLTRGQAFPVILTFDGQQPFNVNAVGTTPQMVMVPMPDNSALIKQFRKSKNMSAFTQGQLFQFDLRSTGVLIPALVGCVKVINDGGLAAARDFVIRPPVTAAASPPAPPPPVGGSMRVDTSANTPPEFQIEAIELASNFILKTTLRNPKVLSRSETPVSLASYGAAWRSDEATGFVRIIPPQDGMKGLDVASAVVATDAKDCKAKFASGRTSELVDSEVVFRGFSSCEDSEGMRLSQYFIVSRKKGGFVLFSVVAASKGEEAKAVQKDERLVDFKKAALVAVGQ